MITVYEGRDWKVKSERVAHALSTLDEMADYVELADNSDLRSQLDVVATLGERFKEQMTAVTADVAAVLFEMGQGNAILVDIRSGIEGVIALAKTGQDAERDPVAVAKAIAAELPALKNQVKVLDQ